MAHCEKSKQNYTILTLGPCLLVENRFAGWVTCFVPDDTTFVRIDLKGPDNSLRLRQVKALGSVPGAPVAPQSHEMEGPNSSRLIQRDNCRAETLRVFRLITGQVFGRLLLAGLATNYFLFLFPFCKKNHLFSWRAN